MYTMYYMPQIMPLLTLALVCMWYEKSTARPLVVVNIYPFSQLVVHVKKVFDKILYYNKGLTSFKQTLPPPFPNLYKRPCHVLDCSGHL